MRIKRIVHIKDTTGLNATLSILGNLSTIKSILRWVPKKGHKLWQGL